MYRNREMYREFSRFLIHLRGGGAEMYRLDLKCIEQVKCMESMRSAECGMGRASPGAPGLVAGLAPRVSPADGTRDQPTGRCPPATLSPRERGEGM